MATPWATSSELERWRRPVMESATTADSRLSMAPKSANDAAAGRTATILATDRSARCGSGNDPEMPPKRLPMVSTGKRNPSASADVAATAIRNEGHGGRRQ